MPGDGGDGGYGGDGGDGGDSGDGGDVLHMIPGHGAARGGGQGDGVGVPGYGSHNTGYEWGLEWLA